MGGDDPSPRRVRTNATVPVPNTGLLLFGAGVRALFGAAESAFRTVVHAAICLFAAAFVGLHGVVHDAETT